MSVKYSELPYGFQYGDAIIERFFSDDKKGWITLGLKTSKYSNHNHIQIYVTKTGKVRIFDSNGEWIKPEKKK